MNSFEMREYIHVPLYCSQDLKAHKCHITSICLTMYRIIKDTSFIKPFKLLLYTLKFSECFKIVVMELNILNSVYLDQKNTDYAKRKLHEYQTEKNCVESMTMWL